MQLQNIHITQYSIIALHLQMISRWSNHVTATHHLLHHKNKKKSYFTFLVLAYPDCPVKEAIKYVLLLFETYKTNGQNNMPVSMIHNVNFAYVYVYGHLNTVQSNGEWQSKSSFCTTIT